MLVDSPSPKMEIEISKKGNEDSEKDGVKIVRNGNKIFESHMCARDEVKEQVL